MNLPGFSVRNPVAANLLMWAILLGGAYCAFNLKKELLPSFESDQISIRVPYPGATPEEIDQSVTRRLERELEGIQDVKEVTSEVFEGVSLTTLKLESGADRVEVIGDVRTQVDLVRPDLPEGAEEPEITVVRPFFPVIATAIFGDVSEDALHRAALKVRDDLLDTDGITQVLVSGQRDREIHVLVQPDRLEDHGLSFEQVGRRIQQTNMELPGGRLKTKEGDVGIRTSDEGKAAISLEDQVIGFDSRGRALRLDDVAEVREAFEDRVEQGRFEGKPAVLITIFRTPEQDAIDIATKVKAYVAENTDKVGAGLQLDTITDLSRFINERIELMSRNGQQGLILVMIVLALFLNLRVAFWVAVGLAISFMGTFIVMSLAGLTINLLSLFGLIVVLGMVVDDAIVIGENVFTRIRQGMPAKEAAIQGAREVALPVVAAVTTTCAAFLPLAFIEGNIGAFLEVLPYVVMAALGVSLLEGFLILPAHLAHEKSKNPLFPRLRRISDGIGDIKHKIFEEKMPNAFTGVLRLATKWRYVTLACAMSILIISGGMLAGGIVPFVLFPEMDSEALTLDLEMTAGTSEEETLRVIQGLEAQVLAMPERSKVFSVLGTSFGDQGQVTAADPATVGQITIELKPSEFRKQAGLRSSKEVISQLQAAALAVPGAAKVRVAARGGGPGGEDLEIRVRGEDPEVLGQALVWVREEVDQYPVLARDDFRKGKLEARFSLRPTAAPLGLTTMDIAQQMRHAVFGFEAQDLQREDEEVTVRVMLPEASRDSLGDLARLRISTPSGARLPLEEAARIDTQRGYATVSRSDGKRSLTVKGEVDESRGNTARITKALEESLSKVGEKFPGVTLSFEGQKKETTESVGSLKWGFPAALFFIYTIIAVLFRSYGQPLIVMIAIPFSLVGAIFGHWVTGFDLTMLSMIGMVALTGIVVNDSLILVDFINRRRAEGLGVRESAIGGARDRLRPILLTSITTVAGLAPLMLETSFQAQFLIPMAISITFGLAFATVVTPLLLPVLYMVFDDIKRGVAWIWSGSPKAPNQQPPELPDLS